ncbi:hypothetical protein BCL69_102940 [Nitrosomonas communis]|uniref:Uncharacterized protein n=1 Tax=Nitrosomonas communis TaxID=44574 RepID=A0A5D3YB76_9PROT|nr:hypothetical protein BCL69_102940 [Nitrosomonas communis]
MLTLGYMSHVRSIFNFLLYSIFQYRNESERRLLNLSIRTDSVLVWLEFK